MAPVIPNLLVLHCSASPNGRPFTVDDIRAWHTNPKPISDLHHNRCPRCRAAVSKRAYRCDSCGQGFGRGWKKAGYHFVVELDGSPQPLEALNDDRYLEPWEIANGAYGYNGRSVHVCLIGTDKFTEAEWMGLTHISYELEDQFPRIQICGHRELDPGKTCPGFDVPSWLAQGRGVYEEHALR